MCTSRYCFCKQSRGASCRKGVGRCTCISFTMPRVYTRTRGGLFKPFRMITQSNTYKTILLYGDKRVKYIRLNQNRRLGNVTSYRIQQFHTSDTIHAYSIHCNQHIHLSVVKLPDIVKSLRSKRNSCTLASIYLPYMGFIATYILGDVACPVLTYIPCMYHGVVRRKHLSREIHVYLHHVYVSQKQIVFMRSSLLYYVYYRSCSYVYRVHVQWLRPTDPYYNSVQGVTICTSLIHLSGVVHVYHI